MDDKFEIEMSEATTEEPGAIQLPVNFLTIGEIENDDVKVYVRQSVYKAMEKYALADTAHERGTIMIGEYCDNMGKTCVVISDYIEAKYTDASASTLTFTHETWDYVNKEQTDKYSDKKIVGWQHTHPGYGIFLSNYDIFIQENFFNLSFQVAYVIDPVQNLRGFFQWKNGKIEKLKGFYIYDEVGKQIKIDKPKEKKVAAKSSKKGLIVSGIVLLSVIIAAGALLISMNKRIQAKDQYILNLEQRAEQVALDNGNTISLEELVLKEAEQEDTIRDLQDAITTYEEKLEGAKCFQPYTVVAGDTLWNICKQKNIPYNEYVDAILLLSNMTNPDSIHEGQIVYLPIIED